MKYAIIADIHANLEALEAVLRDMQEQECTHAACLGDIVGYGANPKECLDIIREMGIPCVKGNHDDYCSRDAPLQEFSAKAAAVIQWTRRQLTEEDCAWLRNLNLVEVVDGFTLVHGSLDGPHRWAYVFDKLSAAASLTYQQTPVCFFGHTHVPVAFVRDSMVRGGTYTRLRVDRGKRYFVNPGSVGQPRDGNPQAAYVTCDLDARQVELHRVDYDVPGAAGKVKALPLRLR